MDPCGTSMVKIVVTLYTRRDCCLCDEMKALVRLVGRTYCVELVEVDIDRDSGLRARFDREVPVLFIEGRKAFKYRATEPALRKRLDEALTRKARQGPLRS